MTATDLIEQSDIWHAASRAIMAEVRSENPTSLDAVHIGLGGFAACMAQGFLNAARAKLAKETQ